MPEDKIKFPIQGASSCPHCKSTEGEGRRYIRELEESGKIPKGALKEGLELQVPFPQVLAGSSIIEANPKIPVLKIRFDICRKCKLIYCTGIDLILTPIQFQQTPGAAQKRG
jgi:hypothetical protein